MSQRQQLRLVFSNSIRCSSKPLKMSVAGLRTPSRAPKIRATSFVLLMSELENVSPKHADALAGIARSILAEALGAPLE